MLLGEDRLFGGGHAADRGAVVVAARGIAGADALDEGQPLGRLAVGGAHDMPARGARGGKDSLELHVGQHVRSEAEAELAAAGGIEGVEAGREHHGSDVEFEGLLLLVVFDGTGLADLGAESAFAGAEADAVLAVDDRHARRRLGMRQIDRRPGA